MVRIVRIGLKVGEPVRTLRAVQRVALGTW